MVFVQYSNRGINKNEWNYFLIQKWFFLGSLSLNVMKKEKTHDISKLFASADSLVTYKCSKEMCLTV